MNSFLNIFGIRPQLYSKSEVKYKRSLGFVISFLYFLLCLIFLISILLEYLSPDHSVKFIKTEMNLKDKHLFLNLTEFPIMFGLYETNGKSLHFNNENFSLEIILKISNIKTSNNNELSNFNFTLKECILEDLGIYKNWFNDMNSAILKSHLCLQANKEKLELFDFSNTFSLNYSQMEFLIIQNSKSNPNGKSNSSKTIENDINTSPFPEREFLLDFIYFDFSFNFVNKPIHWNLKPKSKLFLLNHFSRSVYSTKTRIIEFNYDKANIFQNKNTLSFFQVENFHTYYHANKINYKESKKSVSELVDRNIIGELRISLSNYVDYYILTSTKFHSLIAICFSNFQAIFFILYLINYFLSYRLYLFEISEIILNYGETNNFDKHYSLFNKIKLEKFLGKK